MYLNYFQGLYLVFQQELHYNINVLLIPFLNTEINYLAKKYYTNINKIIYINHFT